MHFSHLPYKTKQFFFVLIKLSIVGSAFYFMYHKLTSNPNLDVFQFLSLLEEKNTFSPKNMAFLIILTGFNWFFEILKWQILVSCIKPISFKHALEQCLGALTASLFTPNRIGEYGAKALCFSRAKRKQVMLLNLLGNTTQLATTILFGCWGLWLLWHKFELHINYYNISVFLVLLLIFGAFIGFGLKQTQFKIAGVSLKKLYYFFQNIPTPIHLATVISSVLRYLIFSFQFYVLLHLFGAHLTYYNAMIVITSMYLLASVVPSIFIFDVLIKGGIAVYLFSVIGINDLVTLSIVTLMWLFNVVLPSVFGSYYVLSFNLPKPNNC